MNSIEIGNAIKEWRPGFRKSMIELESHIAGMNETQRAIFLAELIQGVHLADYSDYRLSMQILLGHKPIMVVLHRSFWKRIKDTWSAGLIEFRRRETYIPVKAP